MTTAKHRALDRLRQRKLHAEKEDELTREIEELLEEAQPRVDANLRDDIGDDLLRLVFTACHPVLSTEARVALTLRLLGGLTTDEIARAFLVPEPTIAQRIVRAKRTLTEARVPFEVPGADERVERLAAVLEVIYLIFNEGYSATSGEHWTRPALCEDALRLGRILAELAQDDSEVHGLVALMEIQASRLPARVNAEGEPILLLDQNRARWDQLLDSPRPRRARARRIARRSAGALRVASRDRGVPCARARCGGHGLGTHRGAVRRARAASRRRPSSSSIAPSRCRWRSDPRPGSPSSMRSPAIAHSPAITCCRACAATSSPSSGATPKPRRSSGAPPT